MIKPIIRLELQAVQLVKKKLMKEAIELLGCPTKPLYNPIPINNGRYFILKFMHDGKNVRYAVLFKKERIHSFAKLFKDKGEQGEGESVNVYDWHRHIKDCEKIIYVYQNTHNLEMFWVSPLRLECLMMEDKVYAYRNKFEGKKEFMFSVRYLREV